MMRPVAQLDPLLIHPKLLPNCTDPYWLGSDVQLVIKFACPAQIVSMPGLFTSVIFSLENKSGSKKVSF